MPVLGSFVMALGLAACGPRDADHGGTTAAAPHEMTVVAKDFTFEAPAQAPAGLTTIHLVNQGRELHHLQLIRLADGKTAADLAAAMKQPGPPPPWVISAGGPNAPAPGGSSQATVMLEPGNYVLLCVIPGADQVPHSAKGMVSPLTVTADSTSHAEPQSDITVALTDYTFALSTPITAGAHTMRVENHGAQDHEAFLIRLAPGKTGADVATWVDKQVGPPPGQPLGGVTAVPVGAHAFFTSDFTPGHYAFMCFVPDSKDGKPHIAHGMIKDITVT
jgi:uncharacterized cupredoxin-like copper-binding protein